MLVLGVTGGIGSGKSYICNKFLQRGVPVYDSDKRTKELYEKSPALLKALSSLLGDSVLQNKDGKLSLNRKEMARIIFSDRSLREKVKDVVYPAVMQDFRRWRGAQQRIAIMKKTEVPFVILESAVILENPIVEKDVDFVLSVESPLDLRIQRVTRRDNLTREEVMERISSQWSDEQRCEYSDFIIQNTPEQNIEEQVDSIYLFLKKWQH